MSRLALGALRMFLCRLAVFVLISQLAHTGDVAEACGTWVAPFEKAEETSGADLVCQDLYTANRQKAEEEDSQFVAGTTVPSYLESFRSTSTSPSKGHHDMVLLKLRSPKQSTFRQMPTVPSALERSMGTAQAQGAKSQQNLGSTTKQKRPENKNSRPHGKCSRRKSPGYSPRLPEQHRTEPM